MPNNRNIIVVGSINTDMIVSTDRFPNPGETVLAHQFNMVLGGKGANQAVSAARLGAHVTLAARVGNDVFGSKAIETLKAEQIDVSMISIDEKFASGVALISVDSKAENTIVVSPGANNNLLFDEMNSFENIINENSIAVFQLEIPVDTIIKVCEFAKAKGAKVILNPAPARELPPSLLANVDIITPNQTEAKLLSGITVVNEESALDAARIIHQLGPQIVIITMGAAGSFIYTGSESVLVPSYVVNATDTTAAGDVYNGALAVSLSQDKSIFEAVEYATAAAAISVTRFGAQDSAPTNEEVSRFLSINKCKN
ncbi:ribokinase [Sphingobacterium composti Ten et al. 2007 non Yoo et al. 2007]|uniref:ribokinase n=1 Tax=Sphingobacterium composti TaxID=363260 RepID=UPI00135A3E70|nr:ribokinase [Sphingobacterium composti Ten et al. 2007 non Yoo et al. 2007]